MGGLSSRRGFLGLLPVAATAIVVPVTAIAEEASASSAPRIYEVASDNMEPTLRAGVNSVIAKPVSQFVGNGIYVFIEDGETLFYRAYRSDDRIRLVSDNQLYSSRNGASVPVSDRWFNKHVQGFATATVRHFDRMGGMI